MKVLTRYLIWAHIGPLIFAFVALTGVILINTLAKQLAELAGKGLPMSVVAEFFVLSLPANIALTLPMAVLVSVLYTFSTFATENEITALRASGLDLRRVTLPIVLLAALIAAGMVWFNDQVLPASNYRWRVLMTDVAQTRPLLALREQAINPIRTSDGGTPYYLEAEQINAETGSMRQVSIFDVSEEEVSRTIRADSGVMVFNSTYTDLLLRLYDGDMREVDFGDPASFQVVAFEEQIMRMKGVSDRLERTGGSTYRTDRDMTMAMMQARIDTLRIELSRVRESIPAALIPPSDSAGEAADTLYDSAGFPAGVAVDTAAQIAPVTYVGEASRAAGPDAAMANSTDTTVAGITVAAIEQIAQGPPIAPVGDDLQADAVRYASARAENLEFQIREYQVEIQKKFSIAAATLVFVLIGIPIALRFPSGGIGMVLIVSLAIFGVYYVGLIGGETLGDEGYVPPAVAMWLTNAVFGVLGLWGYLRLGREQGTSRGGALGELPAAIRARFSSRSP